MEITIDARLRASEIVARLRQQQPMPDVAKLLDLPLPYCYFAYSMYNRKKRRVKEAYLDKYLCPQWAIIKILEFGDRR